MRHSLASTNMLILGGFVLFMALVILFAADTDSTGRATTATRVNITNATLTNCTVNAGVGLNTISVPCISTLIVRENVIDDIGMRAMYQYVPGDPDLWRVHNPNLPSYVVSDLQYMSRRVGYVLVMNQARTYQLSGLVPLSTDVPFVAGWNLIGYPSLQVRNVSVSFASINSSFTQAQTYNNSGGFYEIYDNPGGTMNYTVPGQGYWINGSVPDTWTVIT